MEYSHTIRDRQDRLSQGFVKYHQEDSGRRALQQSDGRYCAIPAQLQYAHMMYVVKITNSTCGLEIDRRNYTSHEKTCKRQRAIKFAATFPTDDLLELN